MKEAYNTMPRGHNAAGEDLGVICFPWLCNGPPGSASPSACRSHPEHPDHTPGALKCSRSHGNPGPGLTWIHFALALGFGGLRKEFVETLPPTDLIALHKLGAKAVAAHRNKIPVPKTFDTHAFLGESEEEAEWYLPLGASDPDEHFTPDWHLGGHVAPDYKTPIEEEVARVTAELAQVESQLVGSQLVGVLCGQQLLGGQREPDSAPISVAESLHFNTADMWIGGVKTPEISMANSEGPNFGIPEGGGSSEKDEGWQEIFRRQQRPVVGTKGNGKGGKGSTRYGKEGDVRVMSQGKKLTSTKHKIYGEHDLFPSPLVIANSLGVPISLNAIADPNHQAQVKISIQRGLKELHQILIAAHGPLDQAQQPGIGELAVFEVRVQSTALFMEPEWPQILQDLFPEEFIGFPTGSPMEVAKYPGEDPRCKMHVLAYKSAHTGSLQSNPMPEKTTVMWKSRKQITWKALVYEMPIASPMPAIHVTDLQIDCAFLPRRIFDTMTSRYKKEIALTLKCGAWKRLSHEEILSSFGCKQTPRVNKTRTGSHGERVFVLEISGFSEGDVTHINSCLKDAKQIHVTCSERAQDEDPAGDHTYTPAVLTYHVSTINAVKATLENSRTSLQESMSLAAARVNNLRENADKLIEIRQVIHPITMSKEERLESITRGLTQTLAERARDILDTMAVEDDALGFREMWESVLTDCRSCIASSMETTAVTLDSDKLSNFVFKLTDPEYVSQILGYDKNINMIMETDDKRTKIEMRSIDPDKCQDARQVRDYEANNNNNKKT